MKPKYSVSIRIVTSRSIKCDFSQSLGQETINTLMSLGNYQGVQVTNCSIGVHIFITPVWDCQDVVEEIITKLELEGFERSKIIIVDET